MGEKNLKAINIDLPAWMVKELDDEAAKLGINRKAMINVLLAAVLEARRKQVRPSDQGYLKAVELSFSEEWSSQDDEEAFGEL